MQAQKPRILFYYSVYKKTLAKILYEKFEQGLFSHTIYSDPYIEI